MKIFIAFAMVVAVFSPAAADTFQAAVHSAAPAQPALYSFADIYRLTVSGAAMAGFPVAGGGDSPIRVAVSQAAPAPELQFSVVSMSGPEHWVLLLAGLAAALWVARRRLGYAF